MRPEHPNDQATESERKNGQRCPALAPTRGRLNRTAKIIPPTAAANAAATTTASRQIRPAAVFLLPPTSRCLSGAALTLRTHEPHGARFVIAVSTFAASSSTNARHLIASSL